MQWLDDKPTLESLKEKIVLKEKLRLKKFTGHLPFTLDFQGCQQTSYMNSPL